MPATEPIQGGPYPEPNDPPDGPTQMSALTTWAAGRLVMRFATTAARDTAITSPIEGMVAVTGTGTGLAVWVYRNGGWQDWTPRPEGADITVDTGYAAIGGTFVPPKAHKSPGGLVTIQGLIRRTGETITDSASGTIATLPAGYRPGATTYACMNLTATSATFAITSDGVIHKETPGTWISGSTYVALAATFQAG